MGVIIFGKFLLDPNLLNVVMKGSMVLSNAIYALFQIALNPYTVSIDHMTSTASRVAF